MWQLLLPCVEDKTQREFFIQKTLFSMLYLQHLKDLKDKKGREFL